MYIRITAENFKSSLVENVSFNSKSSLVERTNSKNFETLAQSDIEAQFAKIIEATPLINLANDYYQMAFEEIPYVMDGELLGPISTDIPNLSKLVRFEKI